MSIRAQTEVKPPMRDSATCPFYSLVTATYDPATCQCRIAVRTNPDGSITKSFDPSQCKTCQFKLRACTWIADGIETRREFYHPDGQVARILLYPTFTPGESPAPIHDSNPDYPMDRAGPGWGTSDGTVSMYPEVEVDAELSVGEC